jgi:hypothetical protein
MTLSITKAQLVIMIEYLELYESQLIVFEGNTDKEIQASLENFSSKPEHQYQHEPPKGVH